VIVPGIRPVHVSIIKSAIVTVADKAASTKGW
jgi:hypothetical protein